MPPCRPPSHEEVLALLDEMIARLHELGLEEAEAKARQAARLARPDPAAASQVLAEAAALVRLGAHGR